MTTTIRQQIIDAIETKLAEVLTTAGYQTGMGATVEKAKYKIDPDDLPAVVIWPADEETDLSHGNYRHTMAIRLEGLAAHGATSPVTVAEQILGDLIEAMAGPKWTQNFESGGTTEIEVGDTITGESSGATGYVTGVSLSVGAWADGNAEGTFTLRRLSITEFTTGETVKVGASLNLATLAGALTGTGPEDSTTGGLAENIIYMSGGASDYPTEGQLVTGAIAEFNIVYWTVAGNPFAQPD